MPEVKSLAKGKLALGEVFGEIKTEKIPGETVEQAVIPGAGVAETLGSRIAWRDRDLADAGAGPEPS